MLFNSYLFIFGFLPVTLAGYIWLGRRWGGRVTMGWLVLASLFFYGWWNPRYLALLLISIVFNYHVGRRLSRYAAAGGSPHGKLLLGLGIAANLTALGYFKYAGFLVANFDMLTGSDFHLGNIVLPLAISFITFQKIAFLVDAWKGEAAEYDFWHFALFVTFFPQLIAGPIVYHSEVMPQFLRDHAQMAARRTEDAAVGCTIFFIGLFKKAVLADGIAPHVAPVFQAAQHGEHVSMLVAWGGALAYTFQLYFDFSGYSDMAIGSARLFGIRLPLNFHSPYKATNIIEFWRRWHMTLSRFLRDYVYIPLGGNRRGTRRRYINLLATMLLGGLWHGAGWSFVLWGGLHGVYLTINHAWRARRPPAGGCTALG